jgi:hypothetical protein
VRNRFFQRCLVTLLIFGFGLHASGAVQLLSGTLEKNQVGKVTHFLKKSDQLGVLDVEDAEIEIDSEFEDDIEKSGEQLPFEEFTKIIFNEIPFSVITSDQDNKHSYKHPLFLHFQNYRL